MEEVYEWLHVDSNSLTVEGFNKAYVKWYLDSYLGSSDKTMQQNEQEVVNDR